MIIGIFGILSIIMCTGFSVYYFEKFSTRYLKFTFWFIVDLITAILTTIFISIQM